MLTKKDIINLKNCTVHKKEYNTGNQLIFKNRKVSHCSTLWFDVFMPNDYTNLNIEYPTRKNQNGFIIEDGKIIKKYDDNFYVVFE